jgi:hypothetical protein
LADELRGLRLGALTPNFRLSERLALIVEDFIPENIEYANDRLHISLTHHKTGANRMISSYPSREYLLQCLMASCYIPVYSMGYYGTPPEIDDEFYIDGGYSNNLPLFEDIPTITISPFSGSAMIAPADTSMFEWSMQLGTQSLKVNLHNIVRGAQALFPPSSRVLHAYFEMGYRDAMKFLLLNKLLERRIGTEV